DDEILQMLKPACGDVRAPRQLNQTITKAMLEIGFLQHALDRSCFLSRTTTSTVLDGVLGLHVDDFIGGGENFEREEDLYNKQAYEGTFLDRVQRLNQRFKFGKREFSSSSVCCGKENTQSFSRNEIEVKAEAYIHKVKPISVAKTRRTHPDDPCTPKEISQLRGLNGAMQWPASQCMVQTAATVPVAQGDVSKATVGEAQSAANAVDALEFAKTMLTTMLFPTMQLTGTEMLKVLGRRPCITDCKALYDVANSQAAAKGLTERRTGIEILQVNEKMREFGGVWRWTNTPQQMADGLTKQVRQQFVEKLRRMTHALKYDATFTASKKANQAEDAEGEDGDEHEDQLREHVRATIGSTRTARRIAQIVAAAAMKCVKGEKIEKVETEFPWVLVSLFGLLVAIILCCGCALAATCWLKYTTDQKLMDKVRVHRDARTMAEQKADTTTMEHRANDEREPDNKKLVRTASTQSQCTYRRDLTTPRFQYLREFEKTASLSAEFEA
ncbi:unnamed protein product, partial [Prorocentrum cordatum]